MGELVQFVSKSERDRIRLIREARAAYDSVFPPAAVVSEQDDAARCAITGTDVDDRNGILP